MTGSGDLADSPIVVMGVSGCGKSTIGSALAARLGRPFCDADDLHSLENTSKMAAGIALNDEDRRPWLVRVGERLSASASDGVPIVACSALKRAYRERLRTAAPETLFIHLEVSAAALAARVSHRAHEFMPSSLLASQLSTLEPLAADERGLTVPADRPVEEILAAIMSARFDPITHLKELS